ncbi:DUF4354 family protein [Pseudomonas mucidolens]|uniref:DUF4354 family protein n=1 Tax=Pseudomonas mucidolens TaxID=46679 RepID=UPI001032D051|nr:DUF4354 family protein [Pseudomonas mucidolens]
MKKSYANLVLMATAQENSTFTIRGEFYNARKFNVSILNKGDLSVSFEGDTQFVLLGKNLDRYEMYEFSAKLFSTIDPYMESTGEVFFISKNEEIYTASFITIETEATKNLSII